MPTDERELRLEISSRAIMNARLERSFHYNRICAIEAVTRYINRLYDYYGIFGENEIQSDELAELLHNIVE